MHENGTYWNSACILYKLELAYIFKSDLKSNYKRSDTIADNEEFIKKFKNEDVIKIFKYSWTSLITFLAKSVNLTVQVIRISKAFGIFELEKNKELKNVLSDAMTHPFIKK